MRNLLTRCSLIAILAGAAIACPPPTLAVESSTEPVVTHVQFRPSSVEPIHNDEPNAQAKPVIQLAILLDTSGSMQGLIEQAKAQLWTIVNELATTRRNGVQPELHVALYEYGKSSLAADEGYLRMILPLSRDLDTVSTELFALTTNGGEEYCGWAIREAARTLKWSEDSNDLKMIVIAGNEPFTQGEVDYRDSIREALGKGVIINTIHCGSEDQGIQGEWDQAAKLADGNFSNIDHNATVRHIEAPQDAEIINLNTQLNATYLAYGTEGNRGLERQSAADEQAAAAPAGGGAANVAQRALAKAETMYCNTAWDLVDACREETIKLEDVPDEQLPEQMRGKTLEEKRAIVAEFAAKRAKIQETLKELGAARDKYVAEQRRLLAEQDGDTLGSALTRAIRAQAQRCGFEIQE